MSGLRARRRVLAACFVACSTLAACVAIEHLSSTSQAAIVPNPGSVFFGEVEVGKTSDTQTITFSPASGSDDSTDMIEEFSTSCGSDFSFILPDLPAPVSRRCIGVGTGTGIEPTDPGKRQTHDIDLERTQLAASCSQFEVLTASFGVQFHPTSPNTQSCQMFVRGTFGMVAVGISGTGTLPPLVIAVQPPEVDFGDVRITTTSRVVQVIVRNAGSSTLGIQSVGVDNTTEFQITGDDLGAHSLVAGASETYDVVCRPGTENTFLSNVRVTSNATNAPTALVPIRCRGTDSALVSDPGSPIDLDARVGEPIQQSIRITNTGGATSNITNIQIVGTTDIAIGTMPNVPFNVIPNIGFFDVTVSYPAAVAQSKVSAGKLRITHDGEDQDVILSHSAVDTVLGANPDTIDFGPVCIGSTKNMPVMVFANAPGSFDVTALGAPANAMFSFTGSLGTASGGHANELPYLASVTPTEAGPTSDVVTITTDIPGSPTRDFALAVEALPAGVSANPPQIDYSTVDIGAVSPLKTVKITNCDSTALDVTAAATEGDAAADFTVVGPVPLAQTLQPTESMEIQIVMAPQQADGPGTRVATLVVTHSAGTTSAELIGTALGEAIVPEVEPTELETYYTCSSGGSGGLLVGLVVLGLVIRRRTSSPDVARAGS